MTQARHNVADPPVERYHHPGIGGTYAARMIDLSGDWIAWHGYDGADQADHVYARRAGGETLELSETGGDHARPAVCASACGADVVWVAGQQRLIHAAVGEDVSRREIITAQWLRDPTLWRVDGELRCAIFAGDALQVHQFNGSQWSRVSDITTAGFASRPSGAGDLVACDEYVDGRYRIRLSTGDVIAAEDGNLTQPRLTVDARGDTWLCALREQIVERDGVVSRAAWAVAGRIGEPLQDVAPLHRGLLPIERYFGYSGLRRNPRLVATDDGRVHLLWEQQYDEQEDWIAVWNGLLLARTFDGSAWSDARVLHDGGCCFAVDHRNVQSHTPPIAVKVKAGFEFIDVDLDAAPQAPAHCTAPGKGWSPYTPPKRPARPTVDIGGVTHHLLYGDLHNHSVFSPDAEGHPDELYHFARDVAGIDFSGITDNDFYPEKALLNSESSHQRRLVQHLEGGGFFPFCGFEWTYNDDDDRYNHRSVVFLGSESRIARRIEPHAADADAFAQTLATLNVFAHAHHGEYQLLAAPQETNVEITSGWAINMEISQTAHEHLKRGLRFGFIGGSDGHRAVPGLGGALVGVWVTEPTRAGIVDALRSRRCFATAGDHMAAWLEARGNTLHAFAAAPHALRRVSLIKNGDVIHEFTCSGTDLRDTFTDDGASVGDWYYLRIEQNLAYRDHPHNVCQAAGHLAWSSPVWIEP